MSRTWLLALLALVLALPANAQSPEDAADRRAWANRPLRPGDIVRLKIWREPEMSGDFPVDENGVIVLPRVGRLQVVDESAGLIENKIIRAFDRFLQEPVIDVTLLRRIQVLGAVRTPGLHPVDATMTVSDVLALAGGATTQGEPDQIQLIRNGERIAARLSTNTRIADSPLQSGDQIFVPERNWFSRNSGVIAAGLTSLLIAFLTR